MCAKLAEMGYGRVPTVEKPGDYSIRGGIVDAWSPGEEFPVRAEFFGDDLESLRRFEAATQRSIERIESATLLPAEERTAPEDGPSQRRTTLLDLLPHGSTVLALEHNEYSLAAISDGADGASRRRRFRASRNSERTRRTIRSSSTPRADASTSTSPRRSGAATR